MANQNSNNQIPNNKQYLNSNSQNSKQNRKFDLEERTYCFAVRCRNFVNKLLKTIPNIEYGKQLIRSSGSPAANYIEANESLSKKDFLMKIKICKKEAKESKLWLKLCSPDNNQELTKEQGCLIQEASELTKIFSSISEKSK